MPAIEGSGDDVMKQQAQPPVYMHRCTCANSITRNPRIPMTYRWLKPPSTATICPVMKLLAPRK
jgi:hypothetical protein